MFVAYVIPSVVRVSFNLFSRRILFLFNLHFKKNGFSIVLNLKYHMFFVEINFIISFRDYHDNCIYLLYLYNRYIQVYL